VERDLYDDEHEAFRKSVRAFLEAETVPRYPRWEADGIVERGFYAELGANGFIGTAIPEAWGGGGCPDFRFNAVLGEELMAADLASVATGTMVHNDICIPYLLDLGTEEQKDRWLPGVAAGTSIAAVAMTEPGMGSDLAAMRTTAIRDGDCYVVNGAKTFISNGINADLIVVAAKTDPTARHSGISLLVLERGMVGLERGRNLDKLGLHAQDTAELAFTDVRVPIENLLGTEGGGFGALVDHLAQERLAIAVLAVAAARAALGRTIEYAHARKAFGTSIASFQNTRFRFAEMDSEIDIGQSYVDGCVRALNAGTLTPVAAAKAKWWTTEMLGRVVDTCLQLHGGYGYMNEYPIARAFADSRVLRIYGGATEVLKEVVGRALEPTARTR
jgi:alkylation response protein AidB-like acyl-CoA dehydrogenase